MSIFNSTPSLHFREAVRSLRHLELTDRLPACAEACADDLKAAVSNWLGKTLGGAKSWRKITGQKPQSGDELPGDDHVELWEKDGDVRYVSHPYDLTQGTLEEMISFAKANGLEFSISGRSWYYPTKTMAVMWRKSRRSPGPENSG